MLKNKKVKTTKLKTLLAERKISQRDFIEMIKKKTKEVYSPARISKYVNGVTAFMTTDTAKILAKTLGVKIDDVID